MGPKRRFKYCVYMVECKYGTYYTGWTNDIKKRMEAHNNGTGAKYLRGKGPVQLVFKKGYTTAREAQCEEWRIKRLTRQQKEALVNE